MKTETLINRFDIALQKSRSGNYSYALREFEELEKLSQNPQDIATLRFFQTTCLTDMGRVEDALERLSRVDKNHLAFPNRIDYEYEWARIERALGHKREALSRTEAALKDISAANHREDIRIVSRNLNMFRGILLAECDMCDEAIPVLELVPEEDEGWIEAKIHLGDCLIKKGWFQDAVKTYSSILSSGRKLGTIDQNTTLRNIGSAYFYLGEYTKAIEFFTKVEHSYENNPDLKADLYGFLASAYSHLGMREEAAKYGVLSRGSKLIQ